MSPLDKMQKLIDTCPWDISTNHDLIKIMHQNIGWSIELCAVWRDIVRQGPDAVSVACSMWVRSGLAPHITPEFINATYKTKGD